MHSLLKSVFPPSVMGFVLILLASCDSSRLYEENKEIENNVWYANKPLQFQAQIPDSIQGYNVYINLRNASHYPFSNIFLFLNTTFPDGQIDRDTIEIMLASPEGKWLGDGLGDIWDNRVLFKRNVRFLMKGEYRFEFTQAMRLDPLPGIMDAGIRIELAE
ncbi:MAG: hypothetical protein RLZZ630_729 [Bacteroidota bacterium]